ncbi:cyclopropane-fatty-acyl-phospholipid synthase family protein [uncultured Erythrobacter sp.]|uniref:SAM-dependent methyltransferase n=1 Tax=uncultured Erythrobacter sp. TaxID=263913 RepID=UPI00261EBCE7|nr:cyclopropane-fatty-acyl-phospholipid synthase family protein [uncultured Erythrobacter sp.]
MNAQGLRGEHLLSSGERFAARPGIFARLVAPGFSKIIEQVDAGLESGSLIAHLPDGTTRMLGGRAPGFDAEITLKDWRALLWLATGGVIGFYQAFQADEWESPDQSTLFALFSANVQSLGDMARSSGVFKWAGRVAHWLNRNNRAGSARNIAAHYDLGNDFYRAWLDDSMTYSSALGMGADSLEAAQLRKMEGIAARLGRPKSVLEIGCGWGSLAHHLAEQGADVTAISLSEEQLSWAREHHSPAIDFRLQDYRDVAGQFDAIMSVEMVEALGREYWPDFMDCVARNLAPGGRAAIQYIAMRDDLFEAYAGTVDFIQAYVFPGGMLIKSSEFRALAEERGLEWQGQTGFGIDYADTLKAWHQRFDSAVEEGRLPEGFDQRFIRLWKFYLSYCEGGFRAGNIDVHQVTLVKN